ncbi:MAG: hypothetical protein R3A51_09845 [Nannocystaceae bacterium]|nr:hypothetical protein [Myxococcales bacterium]
MKKVVILLFLLAAGVGGVVVYDAALSPAARACRAVTQQCGADVITVDECREGLRDATEHELAEVSRCVEPSGSCLEIVGCLSGSALRDLGRGFLRGVGGR